VNDSSALSQSAKDALYKSYPDARRAHLKNGGNFPYLSRSTEVNLYIQVSSAAVKRATSILWHVFLCHTMKFYACSGKRVIFVLFISNLMLFLSWFLLVLLFTLQ